MISIPNAPSEFKFANNFITRAKEVEQHDQIVAYYCLYYTAKTCIECKSTTKEAQDFIVKLLDCLETLKSNLSTLDPIKDENLGYSHIENFSYKIFLSADDEDRNGLATIKTARAFLASSVFMQVLQVFDELSPQVFYSYIDKRKN
jgi:vacuolar protein sorting-associated protein VTA1